MFIEIYETIRYKTQAYKRKQSENIMVPTATEDILDTAQNQTSRKSQGQDFETETQRTLESCVDHQQTAPSDHSLLLPGVGHHRNISTARLNLEPSEVPKSESHMLTDMNQSHRITPEKDKSTMPIIIRRKLRILKPKQQENRSRVENQSLESDRFENI